MDEVTEKWLDKRINIITKEIEKCGLENIGDIAENFNFEKRRTSYLEECEFFYKSGEFCHDGTGKEKYCLLCSCNYYNTKSEIGGCNANNPCGKGYFYPRENLGLKEIWDCSDCNYPHTKKATIRILKRIKREQESGKPLKDILNKLFKGDLNPKV